MAVRIRLRRVGSKKNPVWRIVVADKRSPRDGRSIETIGQYNPQTDPSTIVIDEERANPGIIKGSRRKRIANGSGVRVQNVNQLVKQFDQMRKLMRSMANGKMPDPQKLMTMSGQAPRPKVRRR